MWPSQHLPFSISGLKPSAHLYGLRRRKHFNYTAASTARSPQSRVGSRDEPDFERGESPRAHDSVLKNWAILRNLLYRDATNSAGGTFFSSARCFCRLASSRLAAAS